MTFWLKALRDAILILLFLFAGGAAIGTVIAGCRAVSGL